MTDRPIPFQDWIVQTYHPNKPIAVVGAGPSLNDTKHRLKDYEIVIGVNYTFKLVELDYLVVTHFMLLLNLSKGIEQTDAALIYSDFASDWAFQGSRNPTLPGVRFREYADLQCGTSTIVPAIDLACRLGSEVHLFGVDLCKTDGVQYCDGYQTVKTQDDDFFSGWARVVGYQIDALRRLTGKKIIQIV